MNTKTDMKKHFEAIVGEELSEEALQLVQVRLRVASTTDAAGMSAMRHPFVEKKSCRSCRLLDVSGFAQTLDNGNNVLHLTRFICLPARETLTFVHPITVLATPLSSKPCFLTVKRTLVNDGADVEISVFSWNTDGTAAPNISFDWRCRVELLPPVIF
jgi:hypothetical protein